MNHKTMSNAELKKRIAELFSIEHRTEAEITELQNLETERILRGIW